MPPPVSSWHYSKYKINILLLYCCNTFLALLASRSGREIKKWISRHKPSHINTSKNDYNFCTEFSFSSFCFDCQFKSSKCAIYNWRGRRKLWGETLNGNMEHSAQQQKSQTKNFRLCNEMNERQKSRLFILCRRRRRHHREFGRRSMQHNSPFFAVFHSRAP